MTALQVIIKEAKAIRSKNPKMEWKKAVAQASAIYASKHKGKSPVGKKKAVKKAAKKTAKKKIGYSKTRLKTEKGITKYLKNEPKTLFPYTQEEKIIKAGKKYFDDKVKELHKKVWAVKKSATTMHKDTKSHNVNIRVMSGMDHYPIRFTRITNDVYGNPRYVVHYPEFLNSEENAFVPFHKKYEYALKKAKKLGGKKFDNKQYGGGIVFQSYNIEDLEKKIISLRHTTPKIKI